MKLYAEAKQYKLYHGNMLEMLEVLQPNSIDSIVTDPPYELNFMGKGWDNSGIAFNKEAWQKCYEVLKPGGYLLAFGGTRTYHRIACAIEDAGFEMRDCIMYLYGSGFPKSMNIGLAIDKKKGVESIVVGKDKSGKSSHAFQSEETTTAGEYEIKQATNEWNGWGTALKPAYEPIIVARKPFKTSVAENIMNYGVGGINIDECRIESENMNKCPSRSGNGNVGNWKNWQGPEYVPSDLGRFPANVIHDDSEETIKDMNIDDNDASRYFYCAKASKKDRDEGLDMFDSMQTTDGCIRSNTETARKFGANSALRKNIHPTVKPVELMQYLVRLVTPKNGTILDCFMGSNSTGKSAMFENRERNANYKFIGIELTEEYLPICEARIEYALNKYEYDFKKELEEAKAMGQTNIFDFIGSD